MPEPPPRRQPPGSGGGSTPPPSSTPAPAPRAKKRKPKVQRKTVWTYLFFAVIAVIALVAVVQLAISLFGDKSPAVGDHIHAALGVDICGDIVDNAPEFENRAGTSEKAGLHAHADGLIHIHPFTDDEAAGAATVGRFFEYGGWELSEDRIALPGWDDGVDVTNGGTCPDGRPATVRWMINGTEQDGNPADFAPEDGDRITIAFLPEGDAIPEPPDDVLATLASALDGKSVDQ